MTSTTYLYAALLAILLIVYGGSWLTRWLVYRCPLCHKSWWPHRTRPEMLALMRDQRSGKNAVVHRYCVPFVDRPRTVLNPKDWRVER